VSRSEKKLRRRIHRVKFLHDFSESLCDSLTERCKARLERRKARR